VVVLGGIALSCATRSSCAADLVRKGVGASRGVYSLGTNRFVRNEERAPVSEVYGFDLSAATEYDALVEAAQHFFVARVVRRNALGDPASNTYAAITEMAASSGDSVTCLCAPSSDEGRRANTADTYLHFATTSQATPGSTALLITSPIYVPYQFFVAIQHLAVPFGLDIEMIGAPQRGTAAQILATPANFLQEIRSAIRGARSLLGALDEQP